MDEVSVNFNYRTRLLLFSRMAPFVSLNLLKWMKIVCQHRLGFLSVISLGECTLDRCELAITRGIRDCIVIFQSSCLIEPSIQQPLYSKSTIDQLTAINAVRFISFIPKRCEIMTHCEETLINVSNIKMYQSAIGNLLLHFSPLLSSQDRARESTTAHTNIQGQSEVWSASILLFMNCSA